MRTLAVVLPTHLSERLAIESAITSQHAEILKERAMHLEPSDYLQELFPNVPIEELTSDKVWVYVLESAEPIAPIRDGVVLSPDDELAEAQIGALFASSPIYPTEDEVDERQILSPNGSQVSSMSQALSSQVASPTSSRPSLPHQTSSPSFKARPAPATTHSPTIVPRTTRAASLRQSSLGSAGGLYKPNVGKPRESLPKERLEQTFEGVPGHKRKESLVVKSVETPKVQPRLTRAAMLRLGMEIPEKKTRPQSMQVISTSKANGNTNGAEASPAHPGLTEHRRTSSSFVVPPPSIAPRLNRSATLRTQPKAPPTSFMFKSPTTGSQSRPGSSQSMNDTSHRPPSSMRTSSMGHRPPSSMRSSSAGQRPSLPSSFHSTATSSAASEGSAPKTPAAVKAPSIAPRTNKSAALRAAKMEAEAAAIAKQGKKLTSRVFF